MAALPADTYARIAPRSGLAIRNFINVGVGVVDSDYRGEIKVVLFNHFAEDFTAQASDRIAQLILEQIETLQVKKVTTLDDTDRVQEDLGYQIEAIRLVLSTKREKG